MTRNKLDIPTIEAKVRALQEYQPQLVSSGWHQVRGKVSPLTALKGCNLREAIELLTEEYTYAAEYFGCSTDDVRLEKTRSGADLTATRMETEAETEERIKQEVEWRIARIREGWRREASDKSSKKRQIKKLQEQLKQLEK
jgi:hypothetical protein